MQYAVVDIETTGNNIAVDDIIQIGIIVMDDMKIIDRYDSYIFTEQAISPFIESLTGISDETVKDAPAFSDIMPEILSRLQDKVFVAHNINFDLTFLTAVFDKAGVTFKPRFCIDTVDLFKIVYPEAESYQLSILAQNLGVNLVDAHSAIADAQATAELMQLAVEKLRSLPKETLIQLYHLAKKMRNDIEQLLFPLISDYKGQSDYPSLKGLFYKPTVLMAEKVKIDLSLGEFYRQVIEVNQLHYRQEQLYLAELIFETMTNDDMQLIEAEVGSGKSLAYLVAATYYLAEHGDNILLTTATRALQQQLIQADAKLIERTIGKPLPLMLLKSKRNYISVEFVKFILDDPKENHDILLLKMQLLIFLLSDQSGDISQLNINGGRKIYLELMRTLYKGRQDTYLYQDIRQVDTAIIGVTNHSHLLHSGKEGFPGQFSHLIIDEGHQLQEVALDHTYTVWNYQTVKYHLSQLSKEEGIVFSAYHELGESKKRLAELTVSHFELKSVIQYVEQLNEQFFQEIHIGSDQKFQLLKSNATLLEILRQMTVFKRMTDQLQLNRMVNREVNFVHQIYQQMVSALASQHLVFVEGGRNYTSASVYIKDKKLKDIFSMQLFGHFESLTLLSGSLVFNQSIAHLTPLLKGQEKEVVIFDPLSRDHKVTFFIPDDMPNYNYQDHTDYIEQVVLYISSYLATGQKKMMILFNNYQMIAEVESYLQDVTETMLIAQTPQSNAHKLLNQFNQMDSAVLLGTQSFYEGLDYQSADFKCVMIVTIPFIHPSDKRILLMKDELQDSFNDYQLPYAATKIRQAAGRLIRREEDNGIILCMDRRLVEAGYQKIFSSVLSKYDVKRGDVTEFLELVDKNMKGSHK
ncbi:helicase C-terminal domain-containing protein [Macrococcus carouselicus]|uniref:3'-5' exonuclease DinG n=1 Tax=Macrococcus carouselicus TaxID=69969 RepID=A0A9Q8CLB2_9STAP|nr:helicase C-terminal domain-containing protein [Macrococcus carouselicus]TDM04256.1 DEAD/DEAH box helicase [Macrococcus carouselicus]